MIKTKEIVELIERLNKELIYKIQDPCGYTDVYRTVAGEYLVCELLSDDNNLVFRFEKFYVRFKGYFEEGDFYCKDILLIELNDIGNFVKDKLKEVSKEIETLNYKLLELIKIWCET